MVIDKNKIALQLINDWFECKNIKPFGNAADIQLDKDRLEKQAKQVWYSMLGGDPQLHDLCKQFESELQQYKRKVVLEVLQNGSF